MAEQDIIIATGKEPITIDIMVRDFKALGLKNGMVMIMHSSLSKIGWVVGGAQAVVEALLNVVGPDGTIVVPTFTGANSEPSEWEHPPVPESWWQTIRDNMPGFDPNITPTRKMGAIVECIRTLPGAIRTNHPEASFAAIGPKAEEILNGQPLEYPLGDESPLRKIYDLGGSVLLLGVNHDRNTSLHLAEYRATWPSKKVKFRGCAIKDEDKSRWIEFEDFETMEEDFNKVGAAFENETDSVTYGTIGLAPCKFFPQRALVDHAIKWMGKNRE